MGRWIWRWISPIVTTWSSIHSVHGKCGAKYERVSILHHYSPHSLYLIKIILFCKILWNHPPHWTSLTDLSGNLKKCIKISFSNYLNGYRFCLFCGRLGFDLQRDKSWLAPLDNVIKSVQSNSGILNCAYLMWSFDISTYDGSRC